MPDDFGERKTPRFSVPMPGPTRARLERLAESGFNGSPSKSIVAQMALQLGLTVLENLWLGQRLPELLEPVQQRAAKKQRQPAAKSTTTELYEVMDDAQPVDREPGFADLPSAPDDAADATVPTLPCPRCGDEVLDFDGAGVLAHQACGFCSHPSITDGVCGLCSQQALDRVPTPKAAPPVEVAPTCADCGTPDSAECIDGDDLLCHVCADKRLALAGQVSVATEDAANAAFEPVAAPSADPFKCEHGVRLDAKVACNQCSPFA